MAGLLYDLVTVIAEGVEHLIRHPKQIHVEHDTEWLRSLEVIDAEGVHHFVLLRARSACPRPEDAVTDRLRCGGGGQASSARA